MASKNRSRKTLAVVPALAPVVPGVRVIAQDTSRRNLSRAARARGSTVGTGITAKGLTGGSMASHVLFLQGLGLGGDQIGTVLDRFKSGW